MPAPGILKNETNIFSCFKKMGGWEVKGKIEFPTILPMIVQETRKSQSFDIYVSKVDGGGKGRDLGASADKVDCDISPISRMQDLNDSQISND